MSRKAKEAGAVTHLGEQEMLRTKFWSGLTSPTIKSSLRHKFDGGNNFEDLLLAARTVEHERVTSGAIASKKDKAKAKIMLQQPKSEVDKKLDHLIQQMKAFETRLNGLEGGHEPRQGVAQSSKDGCCYECGSIDHYRNDCPVIGRGRGSRGNNWRRRGRGRGRNPQQTSTSFDLSRNQPSGPQPSQPVRQHQPQVKEKGVTQGDE